MKYYIYPEKNQDNLYQFKMICHVKGRTYKVRPIKQDRVFNFDRLEEIKINLNLKNPFYKTKICNSVVNGTACGHQDRCCFAHNLEELKPFKIINPGLYKSRAKDCVNFTEDNCECGLLCIFSHEVNLIEFLNQTFSEEYIIKNYGVHSRERLPRSPAKIFSENLHFIYPKNSKTSNIWQPYRTSARLQH